MIPFAVSVRMAALFACLAGTLSAVPVIDDEEILNTLTNKAGEFAESGESPSADDLAAKTKQGPRLKPQTSLPAAVPAPGKDYETLSKSVFLVGSVFKCDKCNHWHRGGTSTAWCLTSDGLMVTNAHVFKGAKGAAMAVVDRDGHAYPVVELIGYDIPSDVAIFRVKAGNLQAVPIGAPANVGDAISVISNPMGHHFVRTEGSVARYAKRSMGKDQPKTTWMSITADYAQGSSGGPVFNAAGEVVGMVSSTQSIYTGPKPTQPKENTKGDLQMVIHDCVPADAIRALLEPEKSQARK